MPQTKLQLTVGLPASGKTTYSKGRVAVDKMLHRYNYDEFRAMMFANSYRGAKDEAIVRKLCMDAAKESLSCGFNVIIDNTSLTQAAQDRWSNLARECDAKFEIVDFRHVSPADCIARDQLRQGFAHVSPPVIWNMALHAGLMKFDSRPIVIVDVDGTLADHEGIRSPYDEHKVHLDAPHPVVVQWVNNLTSWDSVCLDCGKEYLDGEDYATTIVTEPHIPCRCNATPPNITKGSHQVIVVSGRSTLCAVSTYNWLKSRIQFSAIFMRNRGDRRPDVEVKQEILNSLLKVVPKEQIAFVLDDRPCVIRDVWRAAGITCYPVRGELEDF